MDQDNEKRRLTAEYVQAVLNTCRSGRVPTLLAAEHLTVIRSERGIRYWVKDRGGKTLEPFVSATELKKPNARESKDLTGLDGLYNRLIALHQESSDDDLQLYKPAKGPTKKENVQCAQAPVAKAKVVRNPGHVAALFVLEGWEEEDEDYKP